MESLENKVCPLDQQIKDSVNDLIVCILDRKCCTKTEECRYKNMNITELPPECYRFVYGKGPALFTTD
jgi:hypothetical protein